VRGLSQLSVGVVTGNGVSDLLCNFGKKKPRSAICSDIEGKISETCGRFLLLGLHGGGDRVHSTLDGVGSLLEVRLKNCEKKVRVSDQVLVNIRGISAHLLRVGLDGGGGLERRKESFVSIQVDDG
jgi:hypothetical protein